MRFKPFAAAAAFLLALTPFAHAQDGPYKVTKIQLVGGDGGMDYVTADPDGRNLYVARSGPAGHIGVFNLDTLAQVGDIPGVSAHGGAVDTATGHGFATSKPVTMFDAKTFAIIKKIDVQGNPDGYLNDPYNHRFYILSHAEPNLTVLDDKDGSILGTINIGGAPEQAVADGQGKLYVDIEDKDAIAVIDVNTMKMTGKYDVSSKGGGCAGLAIDTKNSILFAACRDKKNMIILSATDGHILTDLPIGAGCDGATGRSAGLHARTASTHDPRLLPDHRHRQTVAPVVGKPYRRGLRGLRKTHFWQVLYQSSTGEADPREMKLCPIHRAFFAR